MKFAINPLQWLATPDGGLDFTAPPPLPLLAESVARLGWRALMAVPPADMALEAYAAVLQAHGLSPAPGYAGAPLDDPSRREEMLSRVGALARQHAELGLSELFVAAQVDQTAPRFQRPAVGAERDPERLKRIAESLALLGEETHRHGVTACLHQHVGSWIETEDELEWLLEQLDPATVALGPDTGHLTWAGIDVVAFCTRHRSRVKALHVKDIHTDVAARHRGRAVEYRTVVAAGLWAEPGLGDLSLEAVFDALRPSFDGWAVVEVDRPSLPTPEESVRACAEWAAGQSTDG
jgi:inosose dehydratase